MAHIVDRKIEMMLKEIFEVHGGVERWKSLEALEAEISVWGLLFTTKRIAVLTRVRVRASTQEPRFTFFDFPQVGQTGELFGNEEVCIVDSDEKVLAKRVNPRSAFRGLRRWFKWDSLDFTYFGGYATWNYLVTPFLFLRDGFEFEEMEPMQTASNCWSRLRVTFPGEIPTHCRTQIFYFDQNRLLRRLDYTAEVVGHWAHAAHHCDLYQEFDGLKVPTRRRVRPLIFGDKPLPAPTLVAIDVHDVRPIRAFSASMSIK
ncbi:MAG: hypothetical protein KG012_18290 [Deltaproteobacteria bacterium]|nr:hypothetical protein [Deltaproteobacteria bacterium]